VLQCLLRVFCFQLVSNVLCSFSVLEISDTSRVESIQFSGFSISLHESKKLRN
jgi:hypothetical protein